MEQDSSTIRVIRAAAARVLPARTDIILNLAILYQETGQSEKRRHLLDEVLPRIGDRRAPEEAGRLFSKSGAIDRGATADDLDGSDESFSTEAPW